MADKRVESVSLRLDHLLRKIVCDSIYLIKGIGVEGDAHAGEKVQHLARIRKDPTQPNLRQVHLLHVELIESLEIQGIHVRPGQMGENILTRGIDLLALPEGTVLRLGPKAAVRITGLRNPCRQLDAIDERLLSAVLQRRKNGELVRKSGVMSVVTSSGQVRKGDTIVVELPIGQHHPLRPV